MSTLLLTYASASASFLVLALGLVNLPVALYSLAASFRYRAYVRRKREEREPLPEPPAPPLTLFVPCCGEEEGLEENLLALVEQDYPALHVCFVVESSSDGALPAIGRVLARYPARSELVLTGAAQSRGQKVHNLLVALDRAPETEILAFADSDGRPEPEWLRRLVAPLSRPEVGVASTYRFYLPEPASFATLLRSVWNASVLTLLGDHDHNFAWGGSMAIRREVFERIGVVDAWRGALSDDYAMTHAVRRAGLRVEFVPEALVASRGRIGTRELLSWSARQLAITRVYWPALFRVAAVTHALYTSFLVLAPFALSRTTLLLLGLVLFSSFSSGAVRARAIRELAPRWRRAIDRHLWAYALLVPAASFLTGIAVLRALASRRIEWRGKRYEMRSPTETLILGSASRGS